MPSPEKFPSSEEDLSHSSEKKRKATLSNGSAEGKRSKVKAEQDGAARSGRMLRDVPALIDVVGSEHRAYILRIRCGMCPVSPDTSLTRSCQHAKLSALRRHNNQTGSQAEPCCRPEWVGQEHDRERHLPGARGVVEGSFPFLVLRASRA
eukprot:766298-Hanusia_phi.AAC.3